MFFLERKGPTSTNPVPMTDEQCKEKKTEEHRAVNKTVVTTATSTSQGSNQRTLREVQRDVKTDNSSKTPSKDILAQGEVKLMSNCPIYMDPPLLQMLFREGKKISQHYIVVNDDYCYSTSECVEFPLDCLPPRHCRLSFRLPVAQYNLSPSSRDPSFLNNRCPPVWHNNLY